MNFSAKITIKYPFKFNVRVVFEINILLIDVSFRVDTKKES